MPCQANLMSPNRCPAEVDPRWIRAQFVPNIPALGFENRSSPQASDAVASPSRPSMVNQGSTIFADSYAYLALCLRAFVFEAGSLARQPKGWVRMEPGYL